MKCFSMNHNFWRLFSNSLRVFLRGGHLVSSVATPHSSDLSGWRCSTNQVQLGAEDSLVQVLSNDTISQ